MRQVGSIANSSLAERFADFLRAAGTACTVEKVGDGYVIWVHDDDRVAAAKEELNRFVGEPDNPRYRDAREQALTRIREDLEKQKAARRRTVNLSEKWSRPAVESCPMTFGLIAISVIVGFLTKLGPLFDDPQVSRLWFSTDHSLRQIMDGEVWRLITPIFLHFGLLHLLFNMLWTQQFGTQIESRKGTPKFLGMVIVIAALSNLAQFLATGPRFGGMSGVVYGLFGYIWVKGKMEPESGFALPQQTITMMLGWHVLCMLGFIPNVANWAHGVGLVVGIVFGMSGTVLKSFQRKK